MKTALEKASIPTTMAETTQLPKAPTDVDAETGVKVMRLMDALDDHDDVQNVHANFDIDQKLLEEVAG